MKIFLVGFMGCGKSTLGKKLALKLTYEFIDTDKLIAAKEGMSVSAYFAQFGEQAFRELERDTLRNSSFPDNCVIATGGGAPCFFDNMEWMNTQGISIYLQITPQGLAARLRNAKNERPLISSFNDDELLHFITEKLAEREVFYKKAQYIFNGLGISPERILEHPDLSYLR